MRVLIVDDSTVFRKVVRDALADAPDVEIVGSAADGVQALVKIEQLRPDLVTLDLEMPKLDGLGVLRELSARRIPTSVLLLSAFSAPGAQATTQALQLGALDFILKPCEPTLEQNTRRLREQLEPKVRLVAAKVRERQKAASLEGRHSGTESSEGESCLLSRTAKKRQSPRVIAIGVSTGGPAALAKLLPKLPASLPVPVLIVQHMPPIFTRSLAEDLDRQCSISVREASDGDALAPGVAYIAAGGKQMKVVSLEGRPTISITDDPPERACRPSVDYLFRSVADVFGGSVLGIVLTGMGDDGAAGCRALRERGAQIVAQDEASCVVYGMPRQVVLAGLADDVRPLSEIHECILHAVSEECHS